MTETVRWGNPVPLALGPGVLATLGAECGAFGRRVLVVTDPGLAAAPPVADALDVLAAAGLAATVFAGVHHGPSLAVVRAGAAAARAHGAEVVVGLGGGSSLDVAKLVAAVTRAPRLLDDPAWQAGGGLVELAWTVRDPAPLPLVLVPTTHATGSELNPLASLVDDAGRKRLVLGPRLWARLALVDPALHRTVGTRQTAEGSLETLCRVAVPYLTDPADRVLADAQTEALARVLLDQTDAALADPGATAARTELALATAGTVQGVATLGRPRHGHVLWYLGNALAGAAGATKGQGLMPLLRAQLELLAAPAPPPAALGRPGRLARLGHAVLGTAPGDPAAAAAGLLGRLAAWELPRTLAELGLGADAIPALVTETRAAWDGPPLAGLDDAAIAAVYARALTG